ncbi:maleate cis-trans isomerase family protein [Cupriavidus sp. PET2-C1]
MQQTRLGYEFRTDIEKMAKMALIVLRTDRTLEGEVRASLPSTPVALYHSRIFNEFDITPESLVAMGDLLAPTAALFPPDFNAQVVAFGCTSGTMVLGEDKVAEIVHSVHPKAAVTEPVSACIAACAALHMKRIKLITPYRADVNRKMVDGLRARGLEVDSIVSFEEPDDRKVGLIATRSVVEAAVHGGGPMPSYVDGVFISCTTLPTFEALPEIERITGKPATSSNHALAWHMQKLAGIEQKRPSLGRLFGL